MHYRHFTLQEREALYRLKHHEGLSLRAIAARLGRSPASISRELKRNQNNYLGYLPDRAQALAQGRKKQRVLRWWERDPELVAELLNKLLVGWSPELFSAMRQRQGCPSISHESIYTFLYSSRVYPMGWHRLLRHSRTRRKKRRARQAKRTRIPDRIGIEARPQIANLRHQVGHWEADSVLFAKQTAGISVALERSSRYVVLTKLPRKTARHTNAALARLRQYPCLSLTVDNGAEFTSHQLLPMPVYFCAPYHSWEKGSVEQVNGLIRQFLPRSTNLSNLTQADLDQIAELLNTRPRKCLNYQTPTEVLAASVALQG